MCDSRSCQPSAISPQVGRGGSAASSHQCARRNGRERGAATIEYFLILGLVTGMIIAFLGFLFPGGARNFETLINAWGNRLATHIAGDKIDANSDGITDQ